ncbi:MAG TPA: Bax inhibitor-1/YccA family protein [Polyangiaceae bacterium]|jgi:hypothetical protein|nr:Bax inhibitor-1/YccA family protein [Polyangiaceae bacterium]
MYENTSDSHRHLTREQPQLGEADFFWRTYRWMAGGLALSAAVAWVVASTPWLVQLLFSNHLAFYGVMFAELALVVIFATRVSQMSFASAALLFTTYAALNGITLSMIFLVYTTTSVGQVLLICAGAFGGLSFYGATTKRNLSALGHFLFIGLVGLVLGSLLNLFLQSPALYWFTTYAGVLVFAGLAAYDNQKLRQLYAEQGDTGNLALLGALTLYLDFVNLFLVLLRVFGRRR